MKDKLLISYNVEIEKGLEKQLNPKNMNDIFTWKQIEIAIQKTTIEVSKNFVKR